MSKTVFSKIIDGEIPAHIIWQDDDACAFLDTTPIAPGHTLLVPVKPAPYLFELEDQMYASLWKRAQWLAKHIRIVMNCQRVGVMVEGFSVPHVHIHLIPINNGSDLNPDLAKPCDLEELVLHHQRLVTQIASSGTCL